MLPPDNKISAAQTCLQTGIKKKKPWDFFYMILGGAKYPHAVNKRWLMQKQRRIYIALLASWVELSRHRNTEPSGQSC